MMLHYSLLQDGGLRLFTLLFDQYLRGKTCKLATIVLASLVTSAGK